MSITALYPPAISGKDFSIVGETLLGPLEATGVTRISLAQLRGVKIVSPDVAERPGSDGSFFGIDIGGFIVGSAGSTLPAAPAIVALQFQDGTITSFRVDREDLGILVAIAERNLQAGSPPAIAAIETAPLTPSENDALTLDALRLASAKVTIATLVAVILTYLAANFLKASYSASPTINDFFDIKGLQAILAPIAAVLPWVILGIGLITLAQYGIAGSRLLAKIKNTSVTQPTDGLF